MKRIGTKADSWDPKFYNILKHNNLLKSLGYFECDWWNFASRVDESWEFRGSLAWDLSGAGRENPIIVRLRNGQG